MAFESYHCHPERTHSCGDRAADVPVSNDSDGLTRHRHYVEGFPYPNRLIANHAAEVFRKIQNRTKHKLSQRRTKYSAPVGQRHETFNHLRKQRSLQAHGTGMHPTQVWAHSKHFSKECERARPIEEHIGVNSCLLKYFNGISCDNFHSGQLIRQHSKLRLSRIGQYQNSVILHQDRNSRAGYYTTISIQAVRLRKIKTSYLEHRIDT